MRPGYTMMTEQSGPTELVEHDAADPQRWPVHPRHRRGGKLSEHVVGGGWPQPYVDWAEKSLLPAWRDAFGR